MKAILVCSFLAAASLAVVAQNPPASAPEPEIARGRYLVERVAMCGDCHTPHDPKGNPIKKEWLKGAPLPFKPTVPMPWVGAAPAIAGLPQWTDEQMVKFLTTGKTATGGPATPPMPPYRMSEADARAVTAYLRSLGTTSAAKPKDDSSKP